DAAAGAPEELLGPVERRVPGDGRQPQRAARERLADPVLGAEVGEREAPLVAEPAAVDLRVVPRLHALDRALARRRADIAAGGAEAADGRHVLDLPGPRLEAVLRGGQRADRAELDHVPREGRAVRVLREGRDLRVRAAV